MRINLKSLTLAASLGVTAAITGLAGCAHTSDRTFGQAWDDHTTASHVKDALNKEPVFKFPQVDVKSLDRVVQLSGFVQTEEQRQRAGEIASTVPGVKEVVNNILISGVSPVGRTNAPIRMGQPMAPSTNPPFGTNTTNSVTQPAPQ
jgi:hyperosmotically inducible periplasmic protein